ncbi:MAG TPA: glycosyltransferase family 39 protein [Pseudonocardia sp.]|nr:glycosyltransferase family 39 protein [Pseudonocardia sp.]
MTEVKAGPRHAALLALVLVVAGFAYGWRAQSVPLEPYYAAAVRAMAGSWHDFVFGAFDPAGTVTLDKLPGAFWLQALSVRAFGVNTWGIVLPQVVEGVLAVLVLYRIVRRLGGPGAGVVAAAVLAVSPAVVALDRGNISDSLMILLVLLAADAVCGALVDGRCWRLVLAGVWVGLAFQAKMLEAWLVLPALALTYLVAGPGGIGRRIGQALVGGTAAAVVSLSWMVAVSLVPAASRPYVDGSSGNSLFEQVFVYNGFGRVGAASPLQVLAGQGLGLVTVGGAPSPARLFVGDLGHETGWLLPLALVVAVAGLVGARGRPRTDPLRAGYLLWGAWLVVLGAAFSATSTINGYYTAALAPAVAGIVGIGVADLRRQESRVPRVVAAAAIAASAVYAAWLLAGVTLGAPAWLGPVVLVLAAVAAGLLLGGRWVRVGLGLGAAALLLAPTLGAAEIVARGAGALDTPFEARDDVVAIDRLFVATPALVRKTLPGLEKARGGAPDLLAVQSAAVASVFSYPNGDEVLPIGGFTGTGPSPSLDQVRAAVAHGQFHLVLTFPSGDPRIAWIAQHCRPLPDTPPPFHGFSCSPADAAAP